jgi:ribosomal protein S18 acetylase RimI-like enzyme
MQIREFQINDYDAVISLWQAAGLHLSSTDSQADILHKLERDPDLFLVGVENETLVGAVMGAYDGRRGWVYHLAILPDYHGRGFGASLLAELEARLHRKGCRKVNLLIEPTNAEVQHFYERYNFKRAELIFMEKWLT